MLKKYSNQTGFSLVELLVAMAIGLLVMLAALGSASFYEANRRSTVGGNNALENAMASSWHIQKDARMAGLGLSGSNGVAACQTINVYFSGTTQNQLSYMPVSIAKGTNTTSDSISFMYSDPIGTIPASSPICKSAKGATECNDTGTDGPPTSSSELPVLSTKGFADGQVGMLVPPADLKPAPDNVMLPCTMVGITSVQPNANKIQAAPGNSGCTGSKCWNPPNSGPFTKVTGICNDKTTDCNNNSKNIPPGSSFMTTGPLRWVTYSINASNEFQKAEQFGGAAAATSTIAENIVMLRAQYGLSATSGSTAVTSWKNTVVDKNLIKAIRIVIVARSSQTVKDKAADGQCNATTAAPVHGLRVVNGTDDTIPIDLSANDDWKCYHYKTTNMTIPLKNIVMQTSNPS